MKYAPFTYLLSFSLVLCLIGCSHPTMTSEENGTKDSLTSFKSQLTIDSLPAHEQKIALEEQFRRISNKSLTDSTRYDYLSILAYKAFALEQKELFKTANSTAERIAQRLGDTSRMADAHWNYGAYFLQEQVYDSAYYHYKQASELYEQKQNWYYTGKMLYNMAFIRSRLRDYTGSEILIIRAISHFKKVNRDKQLYESYNLLGIIYKELEEYDRAHFYNDEAFDYLEKLPDNFSMHAGYLNNAGVIHQKQGKYEFAIEKFNEALQKFDLERKNKNLYARLIDNRAFSQLHLKMDETVLTDLTRSYQYRDSLQNESGMVISNLHFSEYYAKINDTNQAIRYAQRASVLAKEIGNNRDYLMSLKLLASLDQQQANDYLQTYTTLSDSLIQAERQWRNKFARIDFETDEYIQETKRLEQQNTWILWLSAGLLLILSLAYFLTRQYARNKQLLFESEQQKANEQIYLLALRQQSKMEEGRIQERRRISEDLHDGILGKLFGTRLNLGFLNLKGDQETKQLHKKYLEELQTIEKEIRAISHELKYEMTDSGMGFHTLVNNLLESRGTLGNFEYTLSRSDNLNWEEIDEKIKVNLYRIIQEALQNIVKYSKATHVTIDFQKELNHLQLMICDNGIGFNSNRSSRGIGLKNMRSRTEKLLGTFEIKSEPNDGTKISVQIPLKTPTYETK